MYLFIFFGKYRDIFHLSIIMVQIPPVCREHAHNGRPHTRGDNSILKKSHVMSFQ